MKKETIEDKKLNKLAKEYFSENFSEMDPKVFNNLKNEVKTNKPKKKQFWFKLTCGATALCCLIALCIVLPLTIKPEPLYTYTDLTHHELSLDFCQEYINDNFSNYAFIFDDCNFLTNYGKYAKDSLCILGMEGTKNDIPFTHLTFTLVLNQDIDYPEKVDYIWDAEIIENSDYVLYKKVLNDFQNQKVYALLDYDNYDLYLKFDIIDEQLLNKFL